MSFCLTAGLSISQQAKALEISRGSVSYLPRPVSLADLTIMRRMDELHLKFPFAGSKRDPTAAYCGMCWLGRGVPPDVEVDT